ncbi:hypothetical protein M011DRAFT_65742 [Sporormia fimetaria CBS 119925]|uniref:SigF-like NTF2-like domain-containing protein n=1 Tax=Sporormia fimetaria CBS 119925 TaxID=1340428 RepID=A0A6A6VBT9_9PLEO|nr:hypothetical protein M011DRAFT_65742 [Sporormia fimetaria CBS 119925]
MEDPVAEIEGVIRLLTQAPPIEQHEAIDTYFCRNASFTHPLCRTGNSENSRFLIHGIYRWYKVMSPRIDITVHSVAFDKPNLLLYVNLSQVFRIWIFPWYGAPVKFVTVIGLEHHHGKYYIKSQDDLYQTDQWIRFIPFTPGLSLLVWILQYIATYLCWVFALMSWPVTFVETFKRQKKTEAEWMVGPIGVKDSEYGDRQGLIDVSEKRDIRNGFREEAGVQQRPRNSGDGVKDVEREDKRNETKSTYLEYSDTQFAVLKPETAA